MERLLHIPETTDPTLSFAREELARYIRLMTRLEERSNDGD